MVILSHFQIHTYFILFAKFVRDPFRIRDIVSRRIQVI